jgi:hypothetical protein
MVTAGGQAGSTCAGTQRGPWQAGATLTGCHNTDATSACTSSAWRYT